jgi:hypothetical protein
MVTMVRSAFLETTSTDQVLQLVEVLEPRSKGPTVFPYVFEAGGTPATHVLLLKPTYSAPSEQPAHPSQSSMRYFPLESTSAASFGGYYVSL